MRYAKGLALGLIVALMLYAVYREYRNRSVLDQLPQSAETAQAFLGDLRASRIEDAYARTTFGFARRVGRRGLRDLVASHPEFQNIAEPAGYDLRTGRMERYVSWSFQVPKGPDVPKVASDYLPLRITLVMGNNGHWQVDEVMIRE